MGIVFDDLAPGTPGVETETAPATLLITIPPLQVFARDIETNWMVVQLPDMEATLRQPSALQPTVGHLFIVLPPLSTLFETSANDFGELDITLPQLVTIANEAEGAYLQVTLPSPSPLMLDSVPEPETFGVMLQSAGYVYGVSGAKFNSVSDALTLLDVPLLFSYPALVERMRAVENVTPSSAITELVAQSAVLNDAVAIAWTLLLQESGAAGGSVSSVYGLLQYVEDTLDAVGLVSSTQEATTAIVEAMLIQSLVASGWTADALAVATAQDAIVPALQSLIAVLDSAAIASPAVPTFRLVQVVAEDAELDDALTSAAHLYEALQSGAAMFVVVSFGDASYSGFAMNLANKGVVEYQNFPFNSFAAWRGTYFGASEHGLFELVGDDDAGEPIEAWVRSALSRMATGKRKNQMAMYVGMTTNGRMVAKVVTTEPSGARVEDWYYVTERSGSANRQARAKIGRGLDSVYWAWELHNVAGSDFDLDSVELLPVILDRRV